jgi:hypothetical protein
VTKALAAASLALALGAAAALLTTAVPGPLWYLPLERSFAIGARPHAAVVIDYDARVVITAAACAVGLLLGRALAARLGTRGVRLAGAWAALAGVLAIGLSLLQVWGRPLTPLHAAGAGDRPMGASR